jgi:NTP pyrophosphatase (non-canonical NTP hydrolase)
LTRVADSRDPHAKEMMDFSSYEAAAARTINPALNASERLIDAAAGLAEEAGEALSLVRKHLYQGKPLDREKLELELGDALWCLCMTARAAGLEIDRIAAKNIEKLADRHGARLDTPMG